MNCKCRSRYLNRYLVGEEVCNYLFPAVTAWPGTAWTRCARWRAVTRASSSARATAAACRGSACPWARWPSTTSARTSARRSAPCEPVITYIIPSPNQTYNNQVMFPSTSIIHPVSSLIYFSRMLKYVGRVIVSYFSLGAQCIYVHLKWTLLSSFCPKRKCFNEVFCIGAASRLAICWVNII